MKAPLTAKAVDDATMALAEKEENRRHLGASIIGGSCEREIWYKFRWAHPGNPHPPALMRLFWRGHREEPEIIKLLRKAGVTVYAAGESGELKEQLRISDCEGHFGGTPDAIGENVPDWPTEAVLLEFKTMNENSFGKTKADGVMTAHWEYFVQVQLYMHKHELNRCLFIAACKNNDHLYYELIEANSDIAEKYLARARRLVYADSPPPRIADSIARWPCKDCDFKHICHTEDFPAINCRTCIHATPVGTGNGAWTCDRGHSEISTQRGCADHLYDPRWFDSWKVIEGDFEKNTLTIKNSVETFVMGKDSKHYSSQWLFKHGLAPF